MALDTTQSQNVPCTLALWIRCQNCQLKNDEDSDEENDVDDDNEAQVAAPYDSAWFSFNVSIQ